MPPAGRIPGVIVLALGAGALGFPDAMRLVAGRPRSPLLDIAVCAVAMVVATAYALGTMLLARFVRSGDAMRLVAGRPRSPLLDIAVCAVAMVVATAYALGTMLLARFVRSGDGDAPPADAFARLTFVVSLAAALLGSACLLFLPAPAPAPGAGGLPCHTVDAIAGESDVVVSALVAVAAVVPFARRMLRLRTAPASSPASSS